MIDFTNCAIDLTANYGGSDKKRGIYYNNKKYMLKLSDRIPEEQQNQLNSSYTNSAFSEYISCHIIETLGYSVQNTLLGNISLISSKKQEKVYPVVACENFIPNDCTLVEFKNIENALLTTKPTQIPKISDIYEILTNSNEYFSKEFNKQALERYWDTFIIDALLGNFDRHANNWGYLINNITQDVQLAPIYDCGSCLYPQLADDSLLQIVSSRDEIQLRIDKFPTAALELENKQKASYKSYINSFNNSDCNAALLRVYPKINMNKIYQVIDNTENISDIRKEFYRIMLTERYEQIIQKPYNLLKNQRISSTNINYQSNIKNTSNILSVNTEEQDLEGDFDLD